MKEDKTNISYGLRLKDESGDMVLPSLFAGDEMVKLLSMLTSIKINLSLKSNDSLSQVYDIMNQILQDVIATCCLRLSCISINGTETISN